MIKIYYATIRVFLISVIPLFMAGTVGGQEEEYSAIQTIGSGKVQLVQYEDGSWQLVVNDYPYFVKGMEYSPDPAGRAVNGSNEWMHQDQNNDDQCDAAYNSWVDRNRDNFQDADENAVGDFQLLKEMGCNTIRIYHSDNINKKLLRDLYRNYGIRVIMGNFLGAYTVGSDADWNEGTDYTDPKQRKRMLASVRKMVLENKDEPYLLFWMLGNENDACGLAENSTYNNTNAADEPRAYAEFVNEVCVMIKQLDPDHPVGVCNATYRLLSYYGQYAPEIDIIGMNAYTGPYGFGSLWGRVKSEIDRPVIITEYGVDAYDQAKDIEDEDFQVLYHRRSWQNIAANSCWGNGQGNAIGGVIFSWMDKWWLCGSPKVHDVELGAWKGPSQDGWYNDEWLGVCGQGNGSRSPFIRQPRKVYDLYRHDLWTTPLPFMKTAEECSSDDDPDAAITGKEIDSKPSP